MKWGGTELPSQHSLLLQHRNATVHNNESGASASADAWTNVARTSRFFVTHVRVCQICALRYVPAGNWRVVSEVDKIGLPAVGSSLMG
jgi:hypothetical protein